MTAYRYWGIQCSDTAASGDYMAMASFELREVALGTDRAAGATVLASETYPGGDDLSDPTFAPSKAVDGSSSTFWTTGANSPNLTQHWFMVDLGADYNITEATIQVRPDGFREDPLNFTIFAATGMNPGLAVEEWDFSTGSWSAGEARTFTFSNPTAPPAADVEAFQLGAYVLALEPSEEMNAYQLGDMLFAAAETSSGEYDVTAYQLGAYAYVSGLHDHRDLRAWPFTQDDHDFYVLQLGDVEGGTLVYDKTTGMWASWVSPDFTYWRGADGVAWEGMNVTCDTESGILWEIDAINRLDYNTTPIRSVVSGGLPNRMRKHSPCYMAELAVSEGRPPSGFGDGSVGITLRTSDDEGQSYDSHGEIDGGAVAADHVFRWYGLGLISPLGKLFELTDTGYARRIDGLNVEVPEDMLPRNG